jgi:hypothetical protein
MLKRKIRKLAITGITIVAATLLTTLIAGTASAATSATPVANSAVNPTLLCVHGTNGFKVCARGRGSQAIEMTQPVNGVSAWFYGSGYGEIQEDGTDLCMQLDHAAGNIVIEATCSGPSFQLWEILSTNQIRSDWDKSLCLQYDNAAGNILVAGTCVNTWYEQFYKD